MKPTTRVLLTGFLALGVMSAAYAAETKTPKPIVVKDKVTIKATVEAIDMANRTVTLKGPKGDLVTLLVDESVDRFNQVKVGDHITAEYFESVALELVKAGTPAAPDSVTAAVGAMAGKKPGGAMVAQTTMTVTVEAIDPAIPAVTVRTADGNVQSFRVHHKERLKDVGVGDKIMITQTDALMIAVEAPK